MTKKRCSIKKHSIDTENGKHLNLLTNLKQFGASNGKSRLFFSLLLTVVVGVSIVGFYQYQHTVKVSTQNFSLVDQVKNWFRQERSYLQDHLGKNQKHLTNKLAKTENEGEPIHFEFYQSLPAMQVTVPNLIQSKETDKKTLEINKPKLVMTEKKGVEVKEAADTIQSANVKSIPFMDPKELEREMFLDLAKKSTKPKYIIQLGIFRKEESAAQYQAALAKAGFVARIHSVTLKGKMVFRVEFGPFLNKNGIKTVQLRLREKGFKSFILNE